MHDARYTAASLPLSLGCWVVVGLRLLVHLLLLLLLCSV
jgi:hypothetical protein